MVLQIHLVGGYQIWTQPFICMLENLLATQFPETKILQANLKIPVPKIGNLQLPIVQLVWRSIYVCIATFIAILAPFFNDIVGKPHCMRTNVRFLT